MYQKEHYITLVKESDKYEKIKLVEPNIIHNRPDLLGFYDFQMVQVLDKANNKRIYIPFRLNSSMCDLKIQMMEVEKNILEAVMAFLSKEFRVFRFLVSHCRVLSLVSIKDCCWILNLPSSYEEYLEQFSGPSLSAQRRKLRKLNNDYRCEIKHLTKEEIPLHYIHTLIKRKSEQFGSHDNVILNTTWAPPLYFSLSDAWVMTLNEKLVAMSFCTIVPGSSIACNIASYYNTEYAKYSVGLAVRHYMIKELIERKITCINFGGGEIFSHKKDLHAVKYETAHGIVKIPKPLSFVLYKTASKLFKKNR